MSRQMYFFQTEVDMKAFFSKIADWDACVLTDAGEEHLVKNADMFVSYMTENANLAIVPLAYYQLYQGKGEQIEPIRSVWSGKSIGFSACSIKSKDPYKIEHGRIYLRPCDAIASYHAEMLVLYNKICKFIKKEYVYDRKYCDYMAPDFLSCFSRQECQTWP